MVNMYLLWDGDSEPDGWTLVSGEGGDFYHKLIRAGAVFDPVGGGSLNHSHTLTLISCTPPSLLCATPGSGVGISTHTHTLGSISCGNGDNLPVYKSLKVIKYAGIPAFLPSSVMAFAQSLLTGWERQSELDEKFIHGSDSVGAGGSDVHTHLISGNTNFLWFNPCLAVSAPLPSNYNHDHPVSVNTPNHSNIPSYRTLLIEKSSEECSIPVGLIAMFDGDPGAGWKILSGENSSYKSKFLRGGDTQGEEGGNDSHSPDNQTFTTGTYAKMSDDTAAGTASSQRGHTHDMTVSFSTGDNTPPYIDVIIAEFVGYPITEITCQITLTTGAIKSLTAQHLSHDHQIVGKIRSLVLQNLSHNYQIGGAIKLPIFQHLSHSYRMVKEIKLPHSQYISYNCEIKDKIARFMRISSSINFQLSVEHYLKFNNILEVIRCMMRLQDIDPRRLRSPITETLISLHPDNIDLLIELAMSNLDIGINVNAAENLDIILEKENSLDVDISLHPDNLKVDIEVE